MKRLFIFFLCLALLGSTALAEDTVSSATLSVTALPELKAVNNPVLVAYFSTDDTIRAAAYTLAGLAYISKEGGSAIRAAIQALEGNGYIIIVPF